MIESLELDPTGDQFILRRTDSAGATSSIQLTEDNILTLARSLPTVRDLVLARHTRSGAVAIEVVEGTGIEVNHDPHATAIHLTFLDRHGRRSAFSVPLTLAKDLVLSLPQWIQRLVGHLQTRQ